VSGEGKAIDDLIQWAGKLAEEKGPTSDMHGWNSDRVWYLARRCAAAESRLARLVEAARAVDEDAGLLPSFQHPIAKLRTVLRELEESDGAALAGREA
jgi:hypothetical protein